MGATTAKNFRWTEGHIFFIPSHLTQNLKSPCLLALVSASVSFRGQLVLYVTDQKKKRTELLVPETQF